MLRARLVLVGGCLKLVKSGQVQVGSQGYSTSVLNPATPGGYAAQAPAGSVYVEFDVPTNALQPGGNSGWSQIPTAKSSVGKIAIKNGQPVNPGIPASNITKVSGK